MKSNPGTRVVNVTVTYLEMLAPSQLNPSPVTDLRVEEADIPSPELNRFLYTAVGGRWYWVDRLSWTYEVWQQYLGRDELRTWVGYFDGTPAGYYELERQGRDVEIRSFGLLPQFIGNGHGGDLLTRAIKQAWDLGVSRVWLHTCTLDGPAALKNYLARGFKIYRTEEIEENLPLTTPGPW